MTDADRSRDAIRQAHPRPPLALHRSGTCPGRDGSQDLTSNSSDNKQSVIESHPGQKGARARSLSSQGRATKTRSWPAAVRLDGIHLAPGRPEVGPYRTDHPRPRRPRISAGPAPTPGRATALFAQDNPSSPLSSVAHGSVTVARGPPERRTTSPPERSGHTLIDGRPGTIVLNDN